jgi:hypothetical protein
VSTHEPLASPELISRLLTRRPAEGSTPLTTAFQLGLYRDGTVLNLSDKREVEIRRRAWAMLYHLDRTISLLVGRPASISDAHTDTRPPANLDDEELEGDFDPAGHPLTGRRCIHTSSSGQSHTKCIRAIKLMKQAQASRNHGSNRISYFCNPAT